jgi:hypothetical protein
MALETYRNRPILTKTGKLELIKHSETWDEDGPRNPFIGAELWLYKCTPPHHPSANRPFKGSPRRAFSLAVILSDESARMDGKRSGNYIGPDWL